MSYPTLNDWIAREAIPFDPSYRRDDEMRVIAQEHGMDFVNLNEVVIPQNIVELVPESVARENVVLPLAEDCGYLQVVMSDPLDFDTREKLRFILNRDIEVSLAPREVILQAIGAHYGQINCKNGDATDCSAAVDKTMAAIGDSVDLLGFGEPMHGGDEFLALRNQLFQRLVQAHAFSAIAIESSFPRGRMVNDFVAGRGESYESVQDTGFSHGFGRPQANRELVEWVRGYNAEPSHERQLRFYGFDSPTEYGPTDSPRQLITFVVDYLAAIDSGGIEERRQRIESLLGNDADWENPAAIMDPTKSIGLSPTATSLRIEAEDLIAQLQIRRPELIAATDDDRYEEAAHYANCARQLLNYHAALARASSNRIAECLGLRDAMMADNLEYIVRRERGRGRVFVFAHNSHLKLGQAQWQLGPDLLVWWPAGAHARSMFGRRYVVIGSGVGTSEKNGIGQPDSGTLEARLIASPGLARFIPTHNGEGLPAAEMAVLPTRFGSNKNFSYFPLTPQSFTDFDWLAVLNSIA